MKKILMGLAAAVVLSSGAMAANFGASPADYRASAVAYIDMRLTDSRNAHIQFVSEPYRVVVDVAGRKNLPCWAVDVRVKARTPSGGTGRYLPYTVIFYEGRAIAFEQDVRHLARA